MKALERTARALAQENPGNVFTLHHYPWREQDATQVILLHHHNHNPADPDDFTCHVATTGENLGWGADKPEAESAARYKLMCRTRDALGID